MPILRLQQMLLHTFVLLFLPSIAALFTSGLVSGLRDSIAATDIGLVSTETERTSVPLYKNSHDVLRRRISSTTPYSNSSTTFSGALKRVHNVYVYHLITQGWGGDHDELGIISGCGNDDMVCHWVTGDTLEDLSNKAASDYQSFYSHNVEKAVGTVKKDSYITVALYNFHTWWGQKRDPYPNDCNLQTNLTIVESEEARQRYGEKFDRSFKYYDGVSTTHPTSSIQRVYQEAYLNEKDFLPDQFVHNFSTLIKGGVYVATSCHTQDKANAHRDSIISKLRSSGLRVDGLGRCMPSNPDNISMPKKTGNTTLILKRQTIAKFMFYMAFENSIEPGYVTEKPFDALLAGTVPIYVGDEIRLKSLLPHPKSVIFVADYKKNYSKLAEYLKYLMTNESAYEEHRSWRWTFNGTLHRSSNPILSKKWPCSICEWSVKMAPFHQKRTRVCNTYFNMFTSSASSFSSPVVILFLLILLVIIGIAISVRAHLANTVNTVCKILFCQQGCQDSE